MKSVVIYKKSDKYYVVPQCKTDVGVNIACGKSAVTEISNDLCRLLMLAFGESKEGVPHPANWSEFRSKFFSIFGVKSSSAFHKNTLMVTADVVDSAIILTPYINRGAKHGFEGIREKAVSIPAISSQVSICAAIGHAFSLAE